VGYILVKSIASGWGEQCVYGIRRFANQPQLQSLTVLNMWRERLTTRVKSTCEVQKVEREWLFFLQKLEGAAFKRVGRRLVIQQVEVLFS
jgi:hypothetical protein